MRRFVFLALAPLLLVALSALSPIPSPEPPTYPSPTGSPMPAITVLSVGDSLTYGTDGSASASYRAELSKLMRFNNQPHEWKVEALRGSTCHHWALYLDAAIVAHHPDLIFFNCGTNDDPARDDTEGDYRTILAVATARHVQLVASLIGRPDMGSDTNRVRPWIDDWMHDTNVAIARVIDPCWPASSCPTVPYANMQRVPANPEWLQADGIHLLSRAETAYGQLFYQAAQAMRGWKTLAQMRLVEMCGLSGAWVGDPWPTPDVEYRVCRN